MKQLLLVIVFCVSAAVADAAQAPSTDIYLTSMRSRRGALEFGDPSNITNRPGYDNQPSFSPDSRSLFYTSNVGEQTEIYRYYLNTRASLPVTSTAPESEYSPTVMPTEDAFSVVRVEADSTQRLWKFALDGTNPRLVLTTVQPVGYHAWADENTVAVFVLASDSMPTSLQIADVRSGRTQIVAYNIGRSLHKIPGRHAISFTHRVGELWLKALDLDTRTVTPLVPLLAGNEFYAWLADSSAVMGQGSKLFRYDGDTPPLGDPYAAWEEVADFSGTGISGISRLAVSPDGRWLAIVAQGSGAGP